jgi:alpha-galactosidase
MMLAITFISSQLPVVVGLDNGLGRTPPMGWNSWNNFNCDIHQDLIQQTAQAMVTLGLRDIGYQYINLDDCWQLSRNSSGFIQEDFTKFPSGMRALATSVHSLGLKFGLYSDAGLFTCQRRPGSLGFETKDAASYKEFNIDYLKYDNCFSTTKPVQERYQAMHQALNASGHFIFFSMCDWGVEDPATWGPAIANSWRTTGDINPTWGSITSRLDQNDKWWTYAGPGGWNDPDMLEVGNGKLTLAEQRSHFTLWCLIKAPLLLGNDITKMTKDTMGVITNTELILWNQDRLGIQGHKINTTTTTTTTPIFNKNKDNDSNSTSIASQGLEVWAGLLDRGKFAVVLFNRSPLPQDITFYWKDIGILSNAKFYHVRDVWGHLDLGIFNGNFTAKAVGSHDVAALQLSPVFPQRTRTNSKE